MPVLSPAFITTGPLPSRRISLIGRTLASSRQTRSLNDGLAAIVRLQRDGPRARRASVDPCKLLNSAVARNTPLLLGRSLALGAVAHELENVSIDRAAVDAIVDNFIAALVPRVGRDTQIWLSVDREPERVVVRVAVEPGDPMPERAGEECGLPFVVAARIATLLGGDLAVEEGASGRAWRVRLPV